RLDADVSPRPARRQLLQPASAADRGLLPNRQAAVSGPADPAHRGNPRRRAREPHPRSTPDRDPRAGGDRLRGPGRLPVHPQLAARSRAEPVVIHAPGEPVRSRRHGEAPAELWGRARPEPEYTKPARITSGRLSECNTVPTSYDSSDTGPPRRHGSLVDTRT